MRCFVHIEIAAVVIHLGMTERHRGVLDAPLSRGMTTRN
jgi:hypothetical protein